LSARLARSRGQRQFPETINRDNEMGAMHLTDEEESAVAFMKTLTDDSPATGGDPNVRARRRHFQMRCRASHRCGPLE